MFSERFKTQLIFVMLGLLTASAFFIRLENFKNSRARSIDEFVYYRMAVQVLNEGLSGYNTIPYGKELAATGRDLPEYFFQPLFKHPPLFTFLCALSMKIFGVNINSAAYVSILFGVLLIPLTYLLGALLFGRQVGFLSAIFMWLDPVNTITSQKIWMDTTLAFFSVSSIYFFSYAILRNKNTFLLYCGMATGAAVLTKYPGILPMFFILIYASTKKNELFKNKSFHLGNIITLAMLFLWMYWNSAVYGGVAFFVKQASIHNIISNVPRTLMLVFLLVSALVFIKIKIINRQFEFLEDSVENSLGEVESSQITSLRRISVIFCGFILIFAVHKNLIHGLQFDYLPITTWHQGIFVGSPPTFYIGRLIEFSMFYVFAFISFFIISEKDSEQKNLLLIGAMIIFCFYMVWGSFQSRYILSAIPLLIVIGARQFFEFWNNADKCDQIAVRVSVKAFLLLVLVFIISKILYLNAILSFPNDMCYY